MWVEIFSALFTLLSALVVGIALYRRENAGRTRFVIFVVLATGCKFYFEYQSAALYFGRGICFDGKCTVQTDT